MSITLKIVYKYKSTKYKQTFGRRGAREYVAVNRAAAMVMIKHRGHAADLPGSLHMEIAQEDFVEGLGFRFGGWFIGYINFFGDFWTDAKIIELQQMLYPRNKKILLTELRPLKRTGTIPPCETPSTDPTDLPAATCPTS